MPSAERSKVFADNVLDERVILVTGGRDRGRQGRGARAGGLRGARGDRGTELMSRPAAPPRMAHSSAARAAVWIYTRALTREWAADGIAVLALDDSGTVPTEQRRPPA